MMTALDLAATPETDARPPGTERAAARSPRGARLRRVWRGRPGDPAWVRPGLLALLAAAALLYLIGLDRSGWANAFYSAAVQAGAHSWKAFFFGSFDAANFITVDKPPASLWVMDLSARLFGVNSWSILAPQALEGVACVGVLYLTVRRWFGPAAGLLAGLVLALTPVATLMFRFNNPDALLATLLTLGAYAVTRAIEKGSTRWLVLAAAFVGLGFTTKMLQALLVLPAFAAAYAIAAPTPPWRRARQLAAAGVALLVSCGWWVAIVQLWPAASRPYIGGSQTNSVVELIFGYNGLGRITGNETGSVVPGGAARAGAWGATGLGRLFSSSWGGQIAWLLPAALAFLVALLWLSRRAPRTDRTRAAVVLWGGGLLVTAVVFSFAEGIIHEYYSVALAPAIGALVGIGATALWARRSAVSWRLCLAAIVAATAVWAFVLLDRSPAWLPWLRPTILAVGLPAAAALVVADRLARRAATALAAVGVAIALAGPAVYSVQTASAAHSGSLPSAGPAVSGGRGGGFGPGGGAGLRFGGTTLPAVQAGNGATSAGGAAKANGAPVAPTGAQGGGAPSVQGGRHGGRPGGSQRLRRSGRGGQSGRRRSRWSARCQHAERRAGGPARAQRRPLHLGRGDGRRPVGRRLPARHRRSGDESRRLQRQRSVPEPRPVRGPGGRRQGALLHRRRHGRPGQRRPRPAAPPTARPPRRAPRAPGRRRPGIGR